MFEIIAIKVVVGAIVVASVWIAAALAWNDLAIDVQPAVVAQEGCSTRPITQTGCAAQLQASVLT
jgi:hypothetical protein